jgi:NADPH:quinone reductase-like Zn-dependent oxidoreductase
MSLALVFDDFGTPDVLHLGQVPTPQPGPGQVRIAVRSASVNPVDWKIRSGASRGFPGLSLPHVTGLDASGVIDAIGADVRGWAVGDEIFGQTVTGAAAEHALLENFARKPAGMSWDTSAALPSAVETGLRAIDVLGVGPDDVLVVNGVAGGVGLAAAQFALARGARVLGTASQQRHDSLAALGIESVTYGEGLSERLLALSPSISRALDAAGNGILPELVELVGGDSSHVVTVADHRAAESGVVFTAGQERRYWEAFDRAVELWSDGRFQMPIAQVFPVADGAAAHAASESGHVFGKIVIRVTGGVVQPDRS